MRRRGLLLSSLLLAAPARADTVLPPEDALAVVALDEGEADPAAPYAS